MKLSIGMIVKNEEEYLERCLNGIKPILDSIDSELIVADTGSTDKTVEIAKMFTDNVYHFEWINDFAAARNSTIERAHGEWYMFIDADEIFTSCHEIISFFNSGEYKKYNSASYVIRNLLPSLGDNTNAHYEDFNAPRLTKLYNNTRFTGEIHEFLNSHGQPVKRLNDIAEHYGYLYKNDDEMHDKLMRNIVLLEKKLISATDDELPMLYLQFYESYINFDEKKAYEYLERGINKAKELDSIVLVPLYCSKAQDALAKSKFERAVETCTKYFSMSKKIRTGTLTSDVEIYAINASANYNLNNYNTAIDNYKDFFRIYKLIKTGRLDTSDAYLMSYSIACDRNFLPLLNELIYCCRHTEKYELASDYLKTLPIYKYSDIKSHVSVIIMQIMHVLECTDYRGAGQYYKQLDSYGKQLIKEKLLCELFVNEKKDRVFAAIKEISKNDALMKEKSQLIIRYFKNEILPENELCQLAKKYGNDIVAEILLISLSQKNDITGIVSLPGIDLKLAAYKGCLDVHGFLNAAEEYTPESINITEEIPKAIKLYEYCMFAVLKNRSMGSIGNIREPLTKLFSIYAQLGKRYLESCDIAYEGTDSEIKAAVMSADIVYAREQKRYKDCFVAMKSVIKEYTPITPIIEQYSQIVSDEYGTTLKPEPKAEMDRLSAMVKNNIKKYIENGNPSAAQKTLEEYKKLNPCDTESDDLMKMIESARR